MRSPSRSRSAELAARLTRHGLGGDAVALLDQLDDVAHDQREVEVLRRVDRGDAGVLQRLHVGERDDAADDDRDVARRRPRAARP